jgi:hypothetical protein
MAKKHESVEVKPVTTKDTTPVQGGDVQDLHSGDGKSRKWTISLPYCPQAEIEAETQAQAIEAYNTMMGITGTENTYKVS